MIRSKITNTFTGYDADKLRANFEDAYVKDGVVYWKSNNRSPFEDMLTDWMELDLITDLNIILTKQAKEKQDEEAILAYIEAQANRTEEQIAVERAEARAAFGPGEKIVNILTGETYYS